MTIIFQRFWTPHVNIDTKHFKSNSLIFCRDIAIIEEREVIIKNLSQENRVKISEVSKNLEDSGLQLFMYK